ncbi:MAG: hypothetical protein GYB67_00230 [Chloroflexi bacterium]|nr:hypothetical protein [Chloroflexota bacterium]
MARLLRFLGAVLGSTIALFAGLFTLIGLLAGGDAGLIAGVTNLFLQVTVTTVAVTILIGIFNLFGIHLRRVISRGRGWVYSLVLLLSALLVFFFRLINDNASSMILLETVQVSIESALAGLVLFALVYGAYRLMRNGVTLGGTLFTVVLLVVLVGSLPLPELTFLANVRAWFLAVPVSAGARGILLGIALATVVAGLRILIGQDRSYRE